MENPDALARLRSGGPVPRHVAIIMDGNGRWANDRGLVRFEGHRRGVRAVREVVEGSVQAGIEVLTLFAFSTQNWERPEREVGALMRLLRHYATREIGMLRENGVRTRVLGEIDRLEERTRRAVVELQEATRDCDRLGLNLMVSYSGREELVRAARRIARRAARGEISPDEVDEAELSAGLFTTGLPDPDLLIRTSGEYRLSNFLLWQLAYTELFVSPVLWPDFTRADLFAAFLDYQRRERRFGRVAG
ncbi:MAG: di-trans,poly-cis-decaprenylcistransferase [Gemmatimonadetes bacterium]|nr:di-trans,poly-cis-decaprenylcistransferase [Gemmatimonadota bacterium]